MPCAHPLGYSIKNEKRVRHPSGTMWKTPAIKSEGHAALTIGYRNSPSSKAPIGFMRSRHRRWQTLHNRNASDSVACGLNQHETNHVTEGGKLSITAMRAIAWLAD
ncbi:MAG: hypothetical protein Q4D41_12300 [Prevotellaceae bacterium]|nr:hypothetical protein [Prevotellaceae bacterium]